MIERFKNLSFPVKFGLAILILPLVLVISAYYFQPVRGTVGYEHGLGGFLPFFLILAAEFPLFILLIPWFQLQGSAAATPEVWDLFYPGRKLLLTIVPALALWFIIGYLMGKVGKRLSPKTQKGCLFLLVATPIAGALLLVVKLLLGEWANAMSFGFYP